MTTRLGPLLLILATSCTSSRGGEPAAAEHATEARAGEAHHESGTVRLAPVAIERNQIRIADVAMEPFTGGVEVPAEVELIPDRVAHVTSLVAGQVVSASASLGDKV